MQVFYFFNVGFILIPPFLIVSNLLIVTYLELQNYLYKSYINLYIENIEIVQTNTARFLGVSIDSNLTWKNHIDSITKKVAKSVGIIKRIRHCLPNNILRTLYNTLILPYINYCNIIWAKTKVTKNNNYTAPQKMSTRLHALLVLQKKKLYVLSQRVHTIHMHFHYLKIWISWLYMISINLQLQLLCIDITPILYLRCFRDTLWLHPRYILVTILAALRSCIFYEIFYSAPQASTIKIIQQKCLNIQK